MSVDLLLACYAFKAFPIMLFICGVLLCRSIIFALLRFYKELLKSARVRGSRSELLHFGFREKAVKNAFRVTPPSSRENEASV